MSESPATIASVRSPFKLLDSYGEKDRAIFFGRELEIETLYRLLGESPLVLVYGPSGTGKTSLIQCGLTYKFSPTNWLPITVRRGDDINAALLNAIAGQAITPIKAGTTLTEAIRSIYLDHLRPVYLIFDQFEELYVLGSSSEQERFYGAVKEILESDIACRMIVSLREEYLGALDGFERVVPNLYDKKLRVEAMTNSNVERVILGTVSAFGITLEHGQATARTIIAQISDNNSRVQLAYLQVYLDYLYRRDKDSQPGEAVRFSDAEVEAAGKLGDIMAEFLQGQETAIQAKLEKSNLGIPPGGIARLLEEFVSVEGTKQPTTFDQLLERVPAARPWAQPALDALVKGRLLRLGDGRYELAHDALAVPIDERRSAEEKQLLRVYKMVTNRFADSFQSKKSRLNAAELALVGQARRQIDPFDGSPRLRFDDATEKFVKKCQRSRHVQFIVAVALFVLAIVLPLGGSSIYFSRKAQSAEFETNISRAWTIYNTDYVIRDTLAKAYANKKEGSDEFIDIILQSNLSKVADFDEIERQILDKLLKNTMNSDQNVLETKIQVAINLSDKEKNELKSARKLEREIKGKIQKLTGRDRFWMRLYVIDNEYYGESKSGGVKKYKELLQTTPAALENLDPSLTIVLLGRRRVILERLFAHAISLDSEKQAAWLDEMNQLVDLSRPPDQEGEYKKIHTAMRFEEDLRIACVRWPEELEQKLPGVCKPIRKKFQEEGVDLIM